MPLSLAFPNRFDAASLSGIGWTTGLPLPYLLTRQISQVARAVRTRGSFYAAFPSAITASVLAMTGHNLTTAGQWRVRAFAADPRPVLDVDFTLGLPAGLTCTRASVARFFGSNGLLQTAGNDIARIQHDPVTLAPLGLLVEAGATNSLTWARDLTQTAWTKSNASAALTATGIDGAANSASRVTATAGTARVSATHAVGGSRTFSVFLRRVTGTGAIRLTHDGFATSTAVTLTGIWQRFEVATTGAGTQAGIQLDTSGDVIEVDFAQLEAGASASSPILTSGSTATRSGETIAMPPGGLRLTGALVVHGSLVKIPTATSPVVSIGDGSASAQIRMTSAGVPTGEYGLQASITTAAITPGPMRLGFSYSTNDFRFSSNGLAGTPDTSGTASALTATALQLGSGSNDFAVILSALRGFNAVRTAADLNSLTTTEFEHVAAYDSGLVNAWPADWVSSTTAEERAGVRGTATISTTPQTAQWWRFDVVDTANPAGFIELGRVFLGERWRPQYGALSGATLGYLDRATITEADSGAEYTVTRPLPRVSAVELVFRSEADAMTRGLEIQRQLGTTGELLFSWDDSDSQFQPARTFLARLRTLQPITCLYRGHWRAEFEVKELL
jgi:hypothetical protein